MRFAYVEANWLVECVKRGVMTFPQAFHKAEELDLDPYPINVAYRNKKILEELVSSSLVW